MPYRICMCPWEFYVKPFKIIDNLYYIGNKDVSVHLLTTRNGLVLIDTAFPQTAYQILENIRMLGFDPADIYAIIHTHAHYDHCGSTKALVELTGAKTYLGKDDISIIENYHLRTWANYYGTEFYEQFTIDYTLSDNQKINFGGTDITFIATPGHTDGTMSMFFDVKENGRTYKVGLHGGPGLNTLSREVMRYYDLPEKNRTDFLNSLEKLKKIPVDIQLGIHPFQNNTFGKFAKMNSGSNPFINSDEWLRFLNKLETDAKELFSRDK